MAAAFGLSHRMAGNRWIVKAGASFGIDGGSGGSASVGYRF